LKIYYIHHSCFIVETKSSFLTFDFFESKKSVRNSDFEFEDFLKNMLNSNKEIYVFSSHSHHDHYNSDILKWESNKVIHYIFSDDIKAHNKTKEIHYLKQNEEITLNKLKVNTFTSTDEGVSFLVNVDNINIFHAGDLNWWKWNGDTKQDEENMENAFKDAINDIVNSNISIDVAFFPVDGRLKENYLLGGKYFIEHLSPKLFIPMHFWDNFNVVSSFKNSHVKDYKNTKIININHSNEILNI